MGLRWATAGLVLACALAGEARADVLVLKPLAVGQYYSGYSASQFDSGSPATMTAATTSVNIAMQATAASPVRGMYWGATLEYSLASLPAGATVTGATLSYVLTAVNNGLLFTLGGATRVPPHLVLSLYDGGDGQVTLQDMSKPAQAVGVEAAPVVGSGVFTLTDVSGFNNLPSPFAGLSIMEDQWLPEANATMSLGTTAGPTLTLQYETAPVPEAGSLGLLAGGMMGMVRRWRRGGR